MLKSLRCLCTNTLPSVRNDSDRKKTPRLVCLPVTPDWYAFIHESLSCRRTPDGTLNNASSVGLSDASCPSRLDDEQPDKRKSYTVREQSWSASFVSLYESCLQLAYAHGRSTAARRCVMVEAVVKAAWAPVLYTSSSSTSGGGAGINTQTDGHGNFPGPMCSPFRRSHAGMIQSNGKYTLTEKSDGLRVIVVVLRVARFPHWAPLGQCETDTAVCEEAESGAFPFAWTHISTLVALEAAAEALNQWQATESTPPNTTDFSSGVCKERRGTLTKEQPINEVELSEEGAVQQDDTTSSESNHTHTDIGKGAQGKYVWVGDRIGAALMLDSKQCILQTDPDNPADDFLLHLDPSVSGSVEVIRIRRTHQPRHLTYCFDRSMDAVYLLLDDDAGAGLSSLVGHAGKDANLGVSRSSEMNKTNNNGLGMNGNEQDGKTQHRGERDDGNRRIQSHRSKQQNASTACRASADARHHGDLDAYDQLVLDAELLYVHDRLPGTHTRSASVTKRKEMRSGAATSVDEANERASGDVDVADAQIAAAIATTSNTQSQSSPLLSTIKRSAHDRTVQLALAFFDIFSVKSRPSLSNSAPAHVSLLTRHSMSARYRILCDIIGYTHERLSCLHARVPQSSHHASQPSVRWFVKDMWPVKHIKACLSRLSLHHAESPEYWYAGALGYTRSDGFIFTPDKFDLFSGASKVQLKWKWRSLLSVDWLVSGDDRCSGWHHVVSAYFRKNNFRHRDDVAGHWQLLRPMPLLNPRNFRLPCGATEAPVVAECTFHEEKKMWSVGRLREDKQQANSITTIVSVYESLVECVTIRELLRLLPHAAPCARADFTAVHGDNSSSDCSCGDEKEEIWQCVNALEPCQVAPSATGVGMPAPPWSSAEAHANTKAHKDHSEASKRTVCLTDDSNNRDDVDPSAMSEECRGARRQSTKRDSYSHSTSAKFAYAKKFMQMQPHNKEQEQAASYGATADNGLIAGSSRSCSFFPSPAGQLAFSQPTAKFMLRAVRAPDGSHRLFLNWCTNRGNAAHRYPILCQHCEVRECTGLGLDAKDNVEQTSHSVAPNRSVDGSVSFKGTRATAGGNANNIDRRSVCSPQSTMPREAVTSSSAADADARSPPPPKTPLECVLYIALANAGGSYAWSDFAVEAFFDGSAGVWHILSCHPQANKSEASFEVVLGHLSWLACVGDSAVARELIGARRCLETSMLAFAPLPFTARGTRHVDTERTSAHYDSKASELSGIHAKRSVLRRFNNVVKSRLIDLGACHVRGCAYSSDVMIRERLDDKGECGGHGMGSDNDTCNDENVADGSGISDERSSTDDDRDGAVAAQESKRDFAHTTALRAVDLCCGRGGDLAKWRALRPEFVFMTDASAYSVAEAAARYCCGEGMSLKTTPDKPYTGFEVRMAVHDVFDPQSGLEECLQKVAAEHASCTSDGCYFNFVSCQFSLHYGCVSHERLAYCVRVVAESLVVGGVWVGTTVSDAALLARVKAKGDTFGNNLYQIHVPESSMLAIHEGKWAAMHDANESCTTTNTTTATATSSPPSLPHHAGCDQFGIDYSITVEDTVSNLPEYVLPWNAFVDICRQHDLHLILDEDFATFLDRGLADVSSKHTTAKEELCELISRHNKRQRYGAATSNGTVSALLTEEEREVVMLYRAFMLEKRSPQNRVAT